MWISSMAKERTVFVYKLRRLGERALPEVSARLDGNGLLQWFSRTAWTSARCGGMLWLIPATSTPSGSSISTGASCRWASGMISSASFGCGNALSWTLDETDRAPAGMGNGTTEDNTGLPPMADHPPDSSLVPDTIVDFNGFAPQDCAAGDCDTTDNSNCCDGCRKSRDDDDCDCGDTTSADPCATAKRGSMSSKFLKLLVSIKKLQTTTGPELIKLSAFWADVSTAGDNSLYARLFLTHDLIGIDAVFKADNEGNYLAAEPKIRDHSNVIIMAALRLKQGPLADILTYLKLGLDANLTLASISAVYRLVLFSPSSRSRPKCSHCCYRALGGIPSKTLQPPSLLSLTSTK